MPKLDRIRQVIARVPRGKVTTYGEAARAAGIPRGARLTVRALYGGGALPWHRIVAAGGRIALTGEDGREQRLRLRIEGVTFRGERVRMDLHGWAPRGAQTRRATARDSNARAKVTKEVRSRPREEKHGG